MRGICYPGGQELQWVRPPRHCFTSPRHAALIRAQRPCPRRAASGRQRPFISPATPPSAGANACPASDIFSHRAVSKTVGKLVNRWSYSAYGRSFCRTCGISIVLRSLNGSSIVAHPGPITHCDAVQTKH